MVNVNDTLAERGATYGDFATQAKITQGIKRLFVDSPNWKVTPDVQREALEMIASKLARLLNGDVNHIDSYHDIAGYATLVENYIRSQQVIPQLVSLTTLLGGPVSQR